MNLATVFLFYKMFLPNKFNDCSRSILFVHFLKYSSHFSCSPKTSPTPLCDQIRSDLYEMMPSIKRLEKDKIIFNILLADLNNTI